ncbi:MAG: glycosyltransferase, partial [Phycicoccus sp.]|nr:glycosyltransferase [Phycicoccus sp.]
VWVVFPSHVGMPHLPETIASVLAQTRQADEIVVIENGSTDGTAEWLAVHAPANVRVVVQPELIGAAENWTTAARCATGDLVKLLCADDLLEPTALEAQAAALESHPGAVLAASQRRIIDDWGVTVARNRGLGSLAGQVAGRDVNRACALRGQNLLGEPCSVLFRRSALERHLPWDDSIPYAIDLDMYSRVLGDGSAILVRESLARFRITSGSWSARLSNVQRDQFEAWRDRALAADLVALTPAELRRSHMMARAQDTLRKCAYRLTAIRVRRRLRSA